MVKAREKRQKMILGTVLILLSGAAALPRGSGGMRGHFVREQQQADSAPSSSQTQPVQQVFPSEPASSLERGRREDAAVVPQASFLTRPQVSRSPADLTASPLHWGRREESSHQLVEPGSEDFQASRQPFYPILSFSTKREDSGAYSYRFDTADGITREETSDVDLERSSSASDEAAGLEKRVVRGWYSYPSPDGEAMIRVDYIADENGFRATQTEQVRGSRPSSPASQRLFGVVQPRPASNRDDSHDGEITSEPVSREHQQGDQERRSSYSNSPSIYYRRLGQGGFFYSYRAPNSLQ